MTVAPKALQAACLERLGGDCRERSKNADYHKIVAQFSHCTILDYGA